MAILRNGEYLIIGGHHRVEALKSLGDKTIPARIYIWDEMEKDTRKIFKNTFILPIREMYPEYYKNFDLDLFE